MTLNGTTDNWGDETDFPEGLGGGDSAHDLVEGVVGPPMLTVDPDAFKAEDVEGTDLPSAYVFTKPRLLDDASTEDHPTEEDQLLSELKAKPSNRERLRIILEDWLVSKLPESPHTVHIFRLRFGGDPEYTRNLQHLQHFVGIDDEESALGVLSTIKRLIFEETDFPSLILVAEQLEDIHKRLGELEVEEVELELDDTSADDMTELAARLLDIIEIKGRSAHRVIDASCDLVVDEAVKAVDVARLQAAVDAHEAIQSIESTRDEAMRQTSKSVRSSMLLPGAAIVALSFGAATLGSYVGSRPEASSASTQIELSDWKASSRSFEDTIRSRESDAKNSLVVDCGTATVDGKFSDIRLLADQKPVWMTADAVRKACEGRQEVLFSTWD